MTRWCGWRERRGRRRSNRSAPLNKLVMPGLDPGIHVFLCLPENVDGRDKPGHDG
jgi:hypothetical protein